MVPEPTYEFYATVHRGRASMEDFADALPEAAARARLLVASADVPERCADAYMHAVCALVDRVSGIDSRGTVASETVGSTSVTYTESAASSTDYDAVLPWLAGTGLIYAGSGCRR